QTAGCRSRRKTPPSKSRFPYQCGYRARGPKRCRASDRRARPETYRSWHKRACSQAHRRSRSISRHASPTYPQRRWPSALLPSPASFQIISQSINPDLGKRQTDFRITVSEVPDLTTVDSFGRPKNSFQYWISTNPKTFDFVGPDVAVIRGPEIRFNKNIPIRD